ncbi:hypothetical protein IKG60_02380 [Candidatus Saccharibacteria bacterium]|nr:hypothetical protein [Candidatus Saccharibacteria bacterium]
MDSDVVVKPGAEPRMSSGARAQFQSDMRAEVAAKIGESRNVLIALSSDPSVDELSAAIGLSLYMDRIGKRATAIYSGATPNTLEFLKPEETFEPSADTLQDFVIAINKDKADHLRYKLDGEYVKIFITPYRHRIAEEDLEFSYGDFNVDLVLALDVANGIDLDSALREHGRIMHDAVIINVTTGNPGKFGEIEWSDKHASSVSEMIAELLYAYGGEAQIAKDEATAFLTGIVAATNRFSNAKTTPETMRLSSKLMESGANQQLVSRNITPDVENEMFDLKNGRMVEEETPKEEEKKPDDTTKLDVLHTYETHGNNDAVVEGAGGASVSRTQTGGNEVSADVTKKEHTLLDDLKAAEESLSHVAEEATPTDSRGAVDIKSDEDVPVTTPSVASVLAGTVAPPEPAAVPEPVEDSKSVPAEPESVPTPVAPESVAAPVPSGPVASPAPSGPVAASASPMPTTDATPSIPSAPSAVSDASSPTSSASPVVESVASAALLPNIPSAPMPSVPVPPAATMPAVGVSGGNAGAPVAPVAPMEPVLPEPVMPDSAANPVSAESVAPANGSGGAAESTGNPVATNGGIIDKPEKILEPSAGFSEEEKNGGVNKYGRMLEDALNSATSSMNDRTAAMAAMGAAAIPNTMAGASQMGAAAMPNMMAGAGQMGMPMTNPATMGAPAVPTKPEINGVPEMNYMPTPGTEILPPPPTPPVGGMMPGIPQMPQMPQVQPAVLPQVQPAVLPQVQASVVPQAQPNVAPQGQPANDPGAFRIPGM